MVRGERNSPKKGVSEVRDMQERAEERHFRRVFDGCKCVE